MNSVTIRPSTVKMCRHCKYMFALGDVCAGCGAPWDARTYWFDESGDMLFDLVSDVRSNADQPASTVS